MVKYSAIKDDQIGTSGNKDGSFISFTDTYLEVKSNTPSSPPRRDQIIAGCLLILRPVPYVTQFSIHSDKEYEVFRDTPPHTKLCW